MGRMYAEGLKDSGMDRRLAIETHLACNHYPSIPCEMAEPCEKAIDAINEGDWDRLIDTPFAHAEHGYKVPARVIAEHAHLDPWLTDVDWWDVWGY